MSGKRKGRGISRAERLRRQQVSVGVHAGMIQHAQGGIDNERADRIVRRTKVREYDWLVRGAMSTISLLLIRAREEGLRPSPQIKQMFKEAETLAADLIHRAWALGHIADELRDGGEGETVEDTEVGAEAPEGEIDAVLNDVAGSPDALGDPAGSGDNRDASTGNDGGCDGGILRASRPDSGASSVDRDSGDARVMGH